MVSRFILGVALALAVTPGLAIAAATATVDRESIDANETFTLTLSVDRLLSDPPDLTPLEDDFEVLNVSAASRSTITNGRIAQVQTYNITLLPRRSGALTIPALGIGGEKTNAVALQVDQPSDQSANGDDLFIVAELDRESTWVQAQAVLSIRIYAALAPRQPQLVPPKVSGADVQVQPIGEDSRYDAEIEGRIYDVLERRYALYPQQSGTVEIGEAVYAARLWERGRLSGRKVFRSEALQLEVAPVPAPPPSHPDAQWFPAESVTISQRWNPVTLSLTAGEPVTREIEIAAVGLMANQIPPLRLDAVSGLKSYPDQPELETTRRAEGFTGFRVERFALIASQGGDISLPEIEVPWWNVNAGRWEIARVASQLLAVTGIDSEPEPQSLPEPTAQTVAENAGAAREPTVWFWTTWVVGGLWLATLAWMLLTKRRTRPVKEAVARPKPGYKLQREHLREAKAALAREDDEVLIAALLKWAAIEYPSDVPRSLTALAVSTSGDTAAIWSAFDASRYGRKPRPDNAALSRAINALASTRTSGVTEHREPALPELTP